MFHVKRRPSAEGKGVLFYKIIDVFAIEKTLYI